MSTSAQGTNKGQPWSRGRGFRPKGPFQPARRPGEAVGNASAKENNETPSTHDDKPSNSYQTKNTNQGNNSYVNSRESGNAANQTQSNQSNGYQNRGNQGNNYQGNSSTRDFRFAGKNQQQAETRPAANQVQSNTQNRAGANEGANKNEPRLLAKYNYKANPSSPLGEPELALKQGQNVSLLAKHPSNDQWWKVRDDDGREGYVPATYVMMLETKVNALPWLENPSKDQEELPEAKPVFKPYKSAYNKAGETKVEAEEKKPNLDYYCDICQKQLNGPKPYGAHMASKAHKEEVELAAEYANM